MTTALTDLAHVLALACLVEDRTRQEQAALERVAKGLDAQRNAVLSTNTRFESDLRYMDRVPCTYTAEHPASDRAGKAMGLPGGCKCDGSRLMRPFTDAALAEPLVDEHGWSRAVEAVRETVIA